MSYLFLRVERDGAELSVFILQPTQIIFRFKSSLQIFVPRSFFLNGELWSLLLMTNFIPQKIHKWQTANIITRP